MKIVVSINIMELKLFRSNIYVGEKFRDKCNGKLLF